jgi:hypothetical protein
MYSRCEVYPLTQISDPFKEAITNEMNVPHYSLRLIGKSLTVVNNSLQNSPRKSKQRQEDKNHSPIYIRILHLIFNSHDEANLV